MQDRQIFDEIDYRHINISEKARLLWFVLCPAYHGATLLNLLLGNHSKIFSTGDTIPFSNIDINCGCGSKVSSCYFWQNIKTNGGTKDGERIIYDFPKIFNQQNNWVQGLQVIYLIMARYMGLKLIFKYFNQGVDAYFAAAAKEKPSFQIFLDGFKNPTRFATAFHTKMEIGGIIHLIRDPRAYCLSAAKEGFSIEESIKKWKRYHVFISYISKICFTKNVVVKYEDLCVNPEKTLKKITDFMGLREEKIVTNAFTNRHWIGNQTLHKYSGHIRNEEKWRDQLEYEDIKLIELELAAAMKKYNYESMTI
jgi:hypothetical protein